MRTDWTDLPEDLRNQIAAKTGPIDRIEPAPTGNHADIASTLHTAAGRVFVKAARKLDDQDGPEVKSLRREAAVNPAVSEFAPRLRWQIEAGEWLVLGFEHVQGRPADFSAGSPDLETLTKTIHAVHQAPCPDAAMAAERRWQRFVDDPTPLAAGGVLLHTDLNQDNFIITTDGSAYVVDWAFVTRGAPWLELILLIPWLLKAGHQPRAAEEWAAQFPAWAEAETTDIDMFTTAFARQWRTASERRQDAWIARHADLTGRWADYRLKR
ncbi:phosphotransferase [Actinomadura verrucosospora]|uniref:Aminoglycoside phosphotransferase n=1 Tax=Actinomadura verrucosospora TaxID=46165 RepID=A0A7D4A156_ACTVE|nr:phosphotransferase [Actinomadura verrucosospora]QKG23204.1 aminoglycoside phosphotransferase [Actinomadura verrucosospora]